MYYLGILLCDILCVWYIKKKYYCEVGIVCGVKNRDLDRNGIDVYR